MARTKRNGFTFIDIIVGTALMLIVFLGILAAFQLSIKVVSQSRNKITAIAIATEQLEKIKNLPYPSVGTVNAVLPYAQGVLNQNSSVSANNIAYNIEIKIKFVSDSADGYGGNDNCNLDYKKAEVKVSWAGFMSGDIRLTTDISPKDKVQEAASCVSQPGGVLTVKVFDAFGIMINSPSIEIYNPLNDELIDSVIPFSGKHDFPLSPAGYRVIVHKSGYNSERSYASGEIYGDKIIITPEKPNPMVIQDKLTETSFSIDRISSFSANTLSPWGFAYFSDSFENSDKISQLDNVIIENGKAILESDQNGYLSPGSLTSITITPENIIKWDQLSFSDLKPVETEIRYRFYYLLGQDWTLIPDSDLNNNSIGFDSSPIDISGIDINDYSQLKIVAELSTGNPETSPAIENWQLSWINSEATIIANVPFNLTGGKIVGKDANENEISKYSENHISNSFGRIDIVGIEWDNYTFSVLPSANLDLIDTNPSPQPIGLNPDTGLEADLYLKADYSLLLTVQNMETLEPVFSASARIYNIQNNDDISQYTDSQGQTYFIPLKTATYNLEVSAAGYSSVSTTIAISGDNIKTITLEQIE